MTNKAIVVPYEAVVSAISPQIAIERVRDGFIRYAKGEWIMPPKVYLQSPPHGDFRAMPAAGDGLALLKWVTSFPRNPQRGLPTVTGTILVSDAATGEWLALIDGRAVTALRTGAAAAIASQALEPNGAESAGIIGCGLHGMWAARCLAAAGYETGVCADIDEAAARRVAEVVGWRTGTAGEALACDVVTLVTPGHLPVLSEHHVRPGLHVNALGADGPGKAEVTPAAVASCELFCDEWTQASHGGELTQAVRGRLIDRDDVTELGEVLTGAARGRTSDEATTLFDSTGLAIQDLAIAKALVEAHRAGALGVETVSL